MSSPLLQRAGSSLSSGGYNSPKSLQRYGSTALGRRASISESPRAGSSGSLVEKPAQAQTSLEDIKKDETFAKFLEEEFNATDFASQALHSGSAASSSRKLQEGILLLEKQLRTEVVNRHDELLAQVSSLKDTENVLAVVRAEVESLRSSVQRVRNEIADPYKQIKLKTRQLAALHGTVELLRYVIRVLKLTGKLREQVESKSGRLDLAKAAQLYSEIDGIRKEADLGGLEAVEAEMGWLSQEGQRIRTEAMKSLEAGMESLNQAEVGSVLQVYYNMGELRQTVEQLMGKYRVQLTKAISAALDMKAISADQRAAPGPGGVARAGTPGLGTAPKAREALWQRMTSCFEAVHGVMVAVWHLQRVLAKKRDPITHVCFLTEAVPEGDPRPTERMWESFTKVLANQMKSAFSASSFCKETFVNGYPKLAGMLDALLERLARDTDVKGVAPAVKPEDKASLSASVEPFQNAYLAQSLKRMQEAVNTLFPQGMRASIPNSDQMSRLASGLLEELGAVQPDPTLTGLVMRGVGTALQLLAERAEYQVATGPDARQVTGPATAAQLRNFAICHHLQELHAKLAAAIPALPSEATQAALGAALGAVHTVASEAVTPLFRAMVERIEALLLQIHDQAWGADVLADDVGGAPANCSRYMEEVERAVLHFRQEFLSKLLVGMGPAKAGGVNTLGAEENIVLGLTKRMASRILLVFVRHAALVRPLSEAGKLRLVRDISVLEFAVGEKLYPVEQLGAPYRAVRAFRPLLFLETDQFPTSPLLHELLPSTVLHHLFSRAPEELRSPHARANATPASYSSYMDDHSEEDIWKRIKASLDAYAQLIKARGDKEFSPIYPLMMSLGQSLLEDYASGSK